MRWHTINQRRWRAVICCNIFGLGACFDLIPPASPWWFLWAFLSATALGHLWAAVVAFNEARR